MRGKEQGLNRASAGPGSGWLLGVPLTRVRGAGVTTTVTGISQTGASSDWRGSISYLNASGHDTYRFQMQDG
ncbi:hypothetical protein IRJ41_022710 [Triplophysa rosa]|uniref:Uncharacterized protein n=1 Tax=Triplophysa rosa TaxID=992332 RepID=A0A9W8C1Z7_TRIRA|nr:hypothetical protein IRJ41_022710 [Triplophysa rosa]